jgi:hypothetical protein
MVRPTLCSFLLKKVRFWQILAIRFWRLFLKIDFAQLIAIAIDITQPEFWI